MPVSVPLIDLILEKCPKEWWPSDFRAIVDRMEESVRAGDEDKTPFGSLGDWCEDHGEPELSRTSKFIHKKANVRLMLQENGMYHGTGKIEFIGLPATIRAVTLVSLRNPLSAIEAVAQLAKRITIAMAELEL